MLRDQTGERNPNWKGGKSKRFYDYKCDQRRRNPSHVYAREQVRRAVRRGKLVRGTCTITGCNEIAQFCHMDYSKPLWVKQWCRKHHRMIDRVLMTLHKPIRLDANSVFSKITAPTRQMTEAELQN
ncbi:MAG: hypothetical protein WC455_27120 [Dehalococcoidia bacterium]